MPSCSSVAIGKLSIKTHQLPSFFSHFLICIYQNHHPKLPSNLLTRQSNLLTRQYSIEKHIHPTDNMALPSTCCGRNSSSSQCVCASQAKCSCGEKPALNCSCALAAKENAVVGARCSCRMYSPPCFGCFFFFFSSSFS